VKALSSHARRRLKIKPLNALDRSIKPAGSSSRLRE
jgi:hypothetical protein